MDRSRESGCGMREVDSRRSGLSQGEVARVALPVGRVGREAVDRDVLVRGRLGEVR